MSRLRLSVLVLAIAATAACTTEEGTPTTTDPPTTTTTAGDPTTTTTGEGPLETVPTVERNVEILECEDADDELTLVCEAYDLVREHYVDAVPDTELAEGAALGLQALDGAQSDELLVCVVPTDEFVDVCDIAAGAADDSFEAAEAMVAGLVHALDPNSAYLNPAALDLVREEQEGEVQGIGALVSPEDETIPGDNKQCGVISETCRLLIVSTISGAPAEEAGLVRDDAIVGVDGRAVTGWTIDEVTAAVRGPAGSEVELTILRDGEELDVTITRAAINIPILETETIGSVGYVGLATFSGSASSQFETAVVERLADGVDTLVIDFRNNPGGLLTTAIDVISVFLDDGDVVVTEGPDTSTSYPVNGNAFVPEEIGVYVVVNRASASASEVVSAALQERGRATVVGESTFGKNTVQQRFGLSNGGGLKLTIARWLTPEGFDFGGTGVAPNTELDVADLTPDELIAEIFGPA